MGPPGRFNFFRMEDGYYGLGIHFSTFPYTFTVSFVLGLWALDLGFGKAYTD